MEWIMSHYKSIVAIMQVKDEVLPDLLRVIESYYDDDHEETLTPFYDTIGYDEKSDRHTDWFCGLRYSDKSYLVLDKSGMQSNNTFIVNTTVASAGCVDKIIANTIDLIASAYIVVGKCEDSIYSIRSRNITLFDQEYIDSVKNMYSDARIEFPIDSTDNSIQVSRDSYHPEDDREWGYR